jgi:hypothetical protein
MRYLRADVAGISGGVMATPGMGGSPLRVSGGVRAGTPDAKRPTWRDAQVGRSVAGDDEVTCE